ncbi:MAG: S41 family peptidase [Patescibacteria group bacterium]|nr:S41 family peptidase [Patescibacteria group bacterium]
MGAIQKKSKKKSFVTGFVLAGSFIFVFFAGLQFGSGAWAFSFSRIAVNANKDLPNRLDYSTVDKVYNDLRQKFDGQLDDQALIIGMKRGLVEAAGDKYTAFLDSEEASAFQDQLNGTFEGIGAQLAKDGEYVIIETPLSGKPAEKAGLRAKDAIIKIDDKDAIGISTAEAVERIRGEKGTTVKLGVARGGELLEFNIVRETINIPSVETSYESNGKIGVIKINNFGNDTVELTNKAAEEFKQKGVKGIIIDVRNNPGGFLDGAVKVSEKWLNKGQVIVEEKRDGKIVQSFKAGTTGVLAGIPTTILINEGSASASEILAGALKDNNAANLVGVTTFGKGSVQETVFYDFGLLKVTVARWFTPNGKNIDESGIEPDTKVELTEEDFANKRDPQKDKAIELLNQKL